MVERAHTAAVRLWGERVGAVAWLKDRQVAAFEFAPAFLASRWDVASLTMPLGTARGRVFMFPTLNPETYLGLPGLLADALPDKFGNAVIDAWLARIGRSAAGLSPVERLCYVGARGMGALEFEPALMRGLARGVPVEVGALVGVARTIMSARGRIDVRLGDGEGPDRDALRAILRVGTSAGGTRPKAVIAMNAEGRVLSGQAVAPAGFDDWLIKFDGVADRELGAPEDYGRIEYGYYLMARAAGIDMTECRLLEENGRAHFMTRRFDRQGGEKRHVQSLCGIAHYDYNAPGHYGYEQAFAVMRRLRLAKTEAIQQYRRMVFNVVARNQDDHTKNIAFLMDRDGRWRLAPAFDMVYARNPTGHWTDHHQMTINGKRDHFTRADLIAVGESIGISKPREILDEIVGVAADWPAYASRAGVDPQRARQILETLRLAW